MIDALKQTKRILIHNDSPADRSRHFGFSVYAETFAKLIADQANRTPLTVAINGAWGSGKTSLMRAVRETLQEISREVDPRGRDSVEVFEQRRHPGGPCGRDRGANDVRRFSETAIDADAAERGQARLVAHFAVDGRFAENIGRA